MKNKTIFSIFLCLILIILHNPYSVQAIETETITFKDTNLESNIRKSLNKPDGSITNADMASLISLDIENSNIKDLSGLENAINLQTLNLDNNQISDISCIENLKNLNELDLSNNLIHDITSLSELNNLSKLKLRNNPLNDLSPLESLSSLIFLDLSHTNIYNISFLNSLINIQELFLYDNHIYDISSISNLKNLKYLNLALNDIYDISSLSGMNTITYLNLDVNNIYDISPLSSDLNLRNLSLYNNNIYDINSLSSLTNLSKIDLGSNNISDILPFININKNGGLKSGSEVDLRWNFLNLTEQNTYIETLNNKGINLNISPQDDNISPKIMYTTPSTDANNVELNSSININFYAFIQKDVFFNNIYVKSNSGNFPINCSINGGTLIINPNSELKSNTTYTVKIPASSIKDLDGNSLKSDYTFTFTTLDTNLLIISSTDPSNNSNKISIDNPINIFFNKTIKLNSYNNIKITDSKGSIINTSLVSNNNTLTLIPEVPLNYASAYTVSIPKDSLTDLSNNELSNNFTLKFTTENDNTKDINQDGMIDIFDMTEEATHYNTNAYDTSWNSKYDINSDSIIDLYDLISISKSININSKDVNQDKKIDILDIADEANHYNTNVHDISWNSRYDINSDSIVDIYDLVLISKSIH
jgi:Leucine-rich repeat (LRR) protein